MARLHRNTVDRNAVNRNAVGLLGVVTFFAQLGSLQAQPTVDEVPEKPPIEAVERGWFFEGDAGVGYLLSDLNDRSYGLSVHTAAYLGYDILPIFNIALGASAFATSVKRDLSGTLPQGDLFYVGPTLRAEVAVLSNERDHLWLRGGLAYSFGTPGDIDGVDYNSNGLSFLAGVGYERFMTLRHFSLGIFAGVYVVTEPDVGVGISLTPTIKYTF